VPCAPASAQRGDVCWKWLPILTDALRMPEAFFDVALQNRFATLPA
jgi:hypothetical protein